MNIEVEELVNAFMAQVAELSKEKAILTAKLQACEKLLAVAESKAQEAPAK